MQEAAQHIIGTHDFACFMTSGADVQSTVRTVYDLNVEKDAHIVSAAFLPSG